MNAGQIGALAGKGRRATWFHPLALPFAVVAVMSFGAPLWVRVTRRPAGLLYDPGHPPASPTLLTVPLSAAAQEALLLTVAGYAAGAVLALIFAAPAPGRPCAVFREPAMRRAGFTLMALSAALRVTELGLTGGRPYGAGQIYYGLASALAALAWELLLPGLILVTLPASRAQVPGRLRGLLRGREWAVLAAYMTAVAVSGERAGLIAPAVWLAWAYGTQVRAIRLRWITAAVLAAMTAGAVISAHRSGQMLPRSPTAIAQAAAGDVSSAPWLVQQTAIHVPATAPFAHGSTYAAALEAQIPGPVAREAGITTRTASAVFRDLIGFTNPGQGFSEAYPAEAYLNFGRAGCLGAGLFLGALMGSAWRKHRVAASRPRDLLYPVLLAGLVYGFRSDAVTQVKDVLYPLLAAGLIMAWCRVRQPTATALSSSYQSPATALPPLAKA